MHADTLYLHVASVEEESFVGRESQRAQSDTIGRSINLFAVPTQFGAIGIEEWVLKVPTMRLRDT